MNTRFSSFVRVIAPIAAALLPLTSMAASSLSPLWTQAGHAARVSGVAVSPDGTVIASSSDDFTVKLWSTNGTLIATLNTAPAPATAVAFSPDGIKLAAGTYYGGFNNWPGIGLVYEWQAAGGWASKNISLAWIRTNSSGYGKVTSLAYAPDSSKLVYGVSSGSNFVLSATNGSTIRSLSGYNGAVGPAAIQSVAYSSQGWVLSGCEDKTIRLWDANGVSIWSNSTTHATNVTSVAFAPSGSNVVSGCLDGSMRLFTTNGTFTKGYPHGVGVTAVAFSPDGTKLASGALDGSVKVWNRSTAALLATFAAHNGAVNSLAFMPDSLRLVSGGNDAAIRLWISGSGTTGQAIGSQQDYVGAVAISADGKLCASANGGGAITVRLAGTGATLFTLAGHSNYVGALAFTPNGVALASGGGPLDPTIKFWSMADGSLMNTIAAGTNGVTALAFSPDIKLLASGADCSEQAISIWSLPSGSLAQTFAGHSNGVTALAFSPDGTQLASGGRRPGLAVKVWSLANGSLAASLAGNGFNVESLAFSPDGGSIAVGASGSANLKIWQVAQSATHSLGSSTNPVYGVAFSPDGTILASIDGDSINYWNVALGSLVETVSQTAFRATSLAFSPNANLLLVGREDGTVALFSNTRGAQSQSALSFAKPSGTAASGFTISANVTPSTRYLLQVSTNLTDWDNKWQVASSSNTATIAIPAAQDSDKGFIRAITPP